MGDCLLLIFLGGLIVWGGEGKARGTLERGSPSFLLFRSPKR